MPSDDLGVWVVYYYDFSSIVIFREEIDALRFAVDQGMQVRFWRYDTDLRNPQDR